MKAEELEVGPGELDQQVGHELRVDPELLRASAEAHARALDLKVRVHAYGHPGPDAQALADGRDAVGFGLRLHLDGHSRGHRLGQLGRGLARAGEADPLRGHRGVERREHLGRRGDVERIDQPAEVLHHRGHGIGLHGVAEVEPGGQMGSQKGHALREERAVVGEEGSAAGALGETVDRHSPDCHASALAPGCGQGVHEAAVTS